MRGHRALAEARFNGYQADNVWIVFLDKEEPKEFSSLFDPEQLLENDLKPEIHIYKGDNIAAADLRCIAGLVVHLVAQKPGQLNRIMKSLIRFKPASIYACDASGVIQYHHSESKQ